MYKLTLYYLIGLLGIAAIFSFFHFLPFNPTDIVLSSLLVVGICVIANFVFAKIYDAVTNVESVFITALIIALIIPLNFSYNLKFFIEAGVISMGAKYLLTIEKRHLFNPAAVAIVILSLLTNFSATWWIGTPMMVPWVLAGGLLLMRKTRRERMVFNFLIAYLLIVGVGVVISSWTLVSVISTWKYSVLNSALFFFTFVMLTEPMTSPATKKLQGYYGFLVALLYSTPQLKVISIGLTPEIALCIGNVFSYIINPNYRLDLLLEWKKQLSSDTFAFGFKKKPDFNFIPGQYMEWTLPHSHTDSRGNRRYFSLASSPTEDSIITAVKFYTPSSSYKQKLLNLKLQERIIASRVAGDFVLPKDLSRPIVFIAGGIGVTPFRSMIRYVIDKNLSANIVMFYSNRKVDEILFSETFENAQAHGIKIVNVLTDEANIPENWSGRRGHINEQMLKEEMPDYKNRTYYISGPQLMVQGIEKTLRDMGIHRKQIITDFFPGYTEK